MPLSLLPLTSKVIQKVIHDQISTFLNSGNLLDNYQSVFFAKIISLISDSPF